MPNQMNDMTELEYATKVLFERTNPDQKFAFAWAHKTPEVEKCYNAARAVIAAVNEYRLIMKGEKRHDRSPFGKQLKG